MKILIWLKGKRKGREIGNLDLIRVNSEGRVMLYTSEKTVGHWPSDVLVRQGATAVTNYSAGEVRKIEFVKEKPTGGFTPRTKITKIGRVKFVCKGRKR